MNWLNDLPLFLLIFIRISSFFMTAPIFISRSIPIHYKIGLSFFLTILVFPQVNSQEQLVLDSFYWTLIIKEALVGIVIGFVASVLFYAVQVAGIFIDTQIGFAMANIFDPQTGIQTPLTGRLNYVLATLFLLALNGHHLLIKGIFYSFDWIAVNQWTPALSDGRVSTYLVESFSRMFEVAFLMAIPVAGALFLVDVALGIVAKTVPQMNVFVVGMPLKVMVNFIIFLLVLPGFFLILQKLFKDMMESMQAIIHILGA